MFKLRLQATTKVGPATPTGALTALLVPSSLLLAAFPVALAGLTLLRPGEGGAGYLPGYLPPGSWPIAPRPSLGTELPYS
jgi:hypothetical protein